MASVLFFIIIIFLHMLCMSPWPTFQSSSDKYCYIVQVEEPSSEPEDLNTYYNSFLSLVATTASTNDDQDRGIIHAYRYALTGFAAMLSENESKELEKKEGVISVWPERTYSLHTTHSPSFLGLYQNIGGMWSGSNYGRGIVIGFLEGITPHHPSFSDYGMPPPPAKWKGKPCQFMKTNFSCNNKIIAARSFVTEHNKTALDEDGHGTHTSSTAAGNFVEGANIFGNANGTAAGIAPLAHLSVYKVCDALGSCTGSAIIAGFDAAIEDGVDVLSISMGMHVSHNFYDDIFVIGAFRAMEKGIFVSLSAGNDGPYGGSVLNGAPWALTVGASTIDREIRATVVLHGNKQQEFHGETAFQPKNFTKKLLPLVYVKNCSSNSSSLRMTQIKGKMVVCEGGQLAAEKAVKKAGGAAIILVNPEKLANTTFAEANVLPTACVGYADGLKIKAYINSTKRPMAKILFLGTVIGDNNIRAPVVAGFSSRGPNPQSPGILKPDILGPGHNILAAWPTSVENIRTKSTFDMKSGTSASCPHLSGVAALLKSAHPDWSPAAIRSAIMTTADVVDHAHGPILDERFLPADIFATGAGHVNPSAASDPGLIYDIKPKDYIPYLCGLKNYTDTQVRIITKNRVKCSEVKSIPEAQLNYPSFALTFTGPELNPQTYTRTVTNVGVDSHSFYKVVLVSPPGIDVRVEPQELKFSKLNQKKQYTVTFSRKASSALNGTAVKGFLKLCSCKQCVTSPIAVILE